LEISVTIYTLNHQLVYDLLGEGRRSVGTRKQLTSELAVRYDSTKVRTAFGFAEMVQITLILTEDITVSLAATLIVDWLLTNLTKKGAQVTKLEIDKIPVELNEDAIKKVVLEKLKKTSQQNPPES